MAAAANGPVNLGQAGKYKIVLSPALQGRSTKEVYTGIRYNHKPDLPSTQESSELVPTSSDDSTFQLSLSDGNEKYSYEGTRAPGDGQYVLIFDPAEQHFVLHQLDSSFDMNLTSTPWEQNTASLRATYEQLGPQPKTGPTRRGKAAANTASKAAGKAAAASSSALKSAPEKKARAAKPKKQAVPPPPPPPPPPKEPTPDAEDSDSDDGLTIEYPGGKPPPRFASHNVTPLYRAPEPSRYVGSDVDAEGEDEEDEDVNMAETNRNVEDLKLPSPVANTDVAMDDDDDDAELDLEAQLELALEKETGAADESSESEEE